VSGHINLVSIIIATDSLHSVFLCRHALPHFPPLGDEVGLQTNRSVGIWIHQGNATKRKESARLMRLGLHHRKGKGWTGSGRPTIRLTVEV
jgi:hypothetical protein